MAVNNNWYETSEDMVMPLPLTEEQIGELPESSLTEEMTEDATSRLYPGIHWPPTTNVIVIPLIPGITMFGYIRFFNASPAANDVDIYVNGRKVASNLSYQNFTEYMKVFPGYYRVAVFAAGTRTNPLTVTNINIAPNRIYTAAVIGMRGDISLELINDNRRSLDGNMAYVRFVQLSPNAPRMDAYWDDSLILEDINYQEVSRYLAVTPGEHNLKLREYISGNVLLEDPSIQVEGGKAYTIYIVGDMYTDRRGLQVVIPLEGTTYLQF